MKSGLLLVAAFMLLATSASGQGWVCEEDGVEGILPREGSETKGMTADPFNVKVIFLRFAKTEDDEESIDAKQLNILQNAETLLQGQSLGMHNVTFSIVY